MGRRKFMTAVYLEPEQLAALRALSEATHVPMAVYIREAVDLVLRRHRPSMLGGDADAEDR